MQKNRKDEYLAPEVEVVALQADNVICGSPLNTSSSNEVYIVDEI